MESRLGTLDQRKNTKTMESKNFENKDKPKWVYDKDNIKKGRVFIPVKLADGYELNHNDNPIAYFDETTYSGRPLCGWK